ncbi:MAG: adenylate/guanylate cyclase domain-containing protein, partial [Gemmatimonadota bacterium]|nr:adenylate/guanylate cyclase domain-containing protein [Gemmatimonadota bacterium]
FTMFRHHWPVALGYSALYVGSYFVAATWAGIGPEVMLTAVFFLGSTLLLGIVAGWSIERYARQEFAGRRALEAERARSERLLRNVLPDPVAERLKSEPGPIADALPQVAVLFADIVDFSGISERLSPADLVEWLNRVFTAFDRIAARAGVEKIKTIGDAYMAVAGVPTPVDDPCGRMMRVAAEMLDEADRRTGEGEPPLRLRIGMACGPVVAGVIGETKFAYDLWGDPVTLASRMQSHGVPDRIQVTAAVVEALDGRWRFEPRGEIEVKGRGTMETWLAGEPSNGEAPTG